MDLPHTFVCFFLKGAITLVTVKIVASQDEVLNPYRNNAITMIREGTLKKKKECADSNDVDNSFSIDDHIDSGQLMVPSR